ncbi:CHAT domain-containing protein [Kribbella sp. NBC_01245]|uniref:CHAT domain-containing protein n=1 Tax=Kribbella sp. NBC_01245 TaxID=2903578 RepID=UPI002E2D6B07|nr:CHAT domain-containing protein [Kribbella sp. NBC_01245]
MSRYQFEIRVSATTVSGTYSTPEAAEQAIGPDKISPDQLQIDTIGLLEDLLNSWDVLDKLMSDTARPSLGRSRQSLLTDRTFKVLGRHLWQLILAGNTVGPALKDAIQQDRNGRALQVLISFEGTDSDTLRLMGLPWEFLYCPLGFFVAARAKLVLSRYVRTTEEHNLDPTKGPLEVRFVLALPEDAGFGDEHIRVNRMIDDLRSLDQVGITVDEWPPDPSLAGGNLVNETAPDVIHLIGACRGVHGNAQIFYSLPGERADWHTPGALIDALVEMSGREQGYGSATGTKLVVLHLCEWIGDACDPSENFERLAPDFINRGIPAVLAMQYPLGARKAQETLKTFYQDLAEGKAVGQAVQTAREAMREKNHDMRWFGAPALYLRCADGPVRIPDNAPVGALSGPSFTVDRPIRESPIRRQLLDVVQTCNLDAASKLGLEKWVDRIASDEASLDRTLRARMKLEVDDSSRVVVFRNMLKVVSGDVRRTG